MFNRTGVVAIAIVVAIVAWGAFHEDGADPGSKPPSTIAHAPRHAIRASKIEARREAMRGGADAGFDGSP